MWMQLSETIGHCFFPVLLGLPSFSCLYSPLYPWSTSLVSAPCTCMWKSVKNERKELCVYQKHQQLDRICYFTVFWTETFQNQKRSFHDFGSLSVSCRTPVPCSGSWSARWPSPDRCWLIWSSASSTPALPPFPTPTTRIRYRLLSQDEGEVLRNTDWEHPCSCAWLALH